VSTRVVLVVTAGFARGRRLAAIRGMHAIHRGERGELGIVVARAIVEAHEAGRAMGTKTNVYVQED